MKNNQFEKLSDYADYSKEKISVTEIDTKCYFSTENMLPNKGGIAEAAGLTTQDRVTKVLPENVLVSNIRPYFKKIYFANKLAGASNDVLCFVAKNGCLPHYLYYLLSSDSFFDYMMSGAKGTKMPRGDKGQIMNFPVWVPEQNEQSRIVSVLSALDEKIENISKINHNLEEQAKAIFKSWFVDATESNTWDSIPLKELVATMRNGDWGKDSPCVNNTEVAYCIRGADIPDVNAGNKGKMPIRYIMPKNYEKKHLVEGDIVVEISGGSPTQSTGRCAVISQALLDRYEQKIVCTNFCKALKPLEGYSHFLYYYWTYLYEKGCFFAYENGTTGIKNLDISGILENEFLSIPPVEMIERFNELCDKIASTIFANGTETELLAQLRDALLPKLMSGEIDVSEVEV